MKNLHITTLREELPTEVRLEVYKEALELFESGKINSDKYCNGFCLLFPMLLWDIEFSARDPHGKIWNFSDTKYAFSELTPESFKIMRNICTLKETNEQRIKFLKEWIEKLTNQIKDEK